MRADLKYGGDGAKGQKVRRAASSIAFRDCSSRGARVAAVFLCADGQQSAASALHSPRFRLDKLDALITALRALLRARISDDSRGHHPLPSLRALIAVQCALFRATRGSIRKTHDSL